jgi:dTDP-4-amino-4,6-dideoxygalactose transaminase
MSEIRAIADRHHLKIIEDASHTHGASWRDTPCGALGDISVFSLQGDKLAPGGEGGVLLCNDDEYHERALCLGDITRIIELPGAARRFAATSFGIKTRIAPLSAALARVQLTKLATHNTLRNANHERLSLALEALGFDTFLPPPHIRRVYFEYIIRPRIEGISLRRLIEALQAEGCRVSQPRYPLLHQQPFFTEGHWRKVARIDGEGTLPDYSQVSLPGTEAAAQQLLRLPIFAHRDNGIIDDYIRAFQKVAENREAIENRP